jgi:hypothetical protein
MAIEDWVLVSETKSSMSWKRKNATGDEKRQRLLIWLDKKKGIGGEPVWKWSENYDVFSSKVDAKDSAKHFMRNNS